MVHSEVVLESIDLGIARLTMQWDCFRGRKQEVSPQNGPVMHCQRHYFGNGELRGCQIFYHLNYILF